LRRTVYRFVIALAAGVILYSLVGFLLAPLLLERRLESGVPAPASSRVAIEHISVNPYTFRIVLSGTSLASADGRQIGTLPRIEARLDAGSLLKRDFVITEAMVERPELVMTSGRAGSGHSPFNAGLSFLVAGVRALAPGRIERLVLDNARIRLGTPARSLDAEVPTGAGEVADFDLEAFELDPGQPSRARFTVNATLPRSATLAGEGRIAFTEQGFGLSGDFEFTDIAIETSSAGRMVVRAPSVVARGVEIDGSSDAMTVALLRLEQPELRLARLRSGRIDLPEWLVRLIIDSDSSIAAVERIEIAAGSALVLDQAVEPDVGVRIDAIDGAIRTLAGTPTGGSTLVGPSADPNGSFRSTPNLRLQGRLPGSGIDRIVASWRRSDQTSLGQLDLALTDVDLALLSPYFRALTGRGLESGRLDLALGVERNEDGARSQARLSIEGLVLGGCEPQDSQRRWPLHRALALLEDRDQRIELNLAGRAKGAAGEKSALAGLGRALRAQLTELGARPFEALAAVAGVPGQRLDRLAFEPGSAELSATAQNRLTALGEALAARPAVALRVLRAYDPRLDRDALAEQQLRLHIALATSARPPDRTRPAALDFDRERVRSVLDEFAVERLSSGARQSVSKRFPEAGHAYYQALFNRLVDNEAVSSSSLRRLAGFRAQTAVDTLLEAGIDEARVRRSDGVIELERGTSAIFVPMEFVAAETQSCE
jgi:hypothetical protein